MLEDILLFIAVGFAAQLVDGAIGMAYGVSASSVLLSLGIPPATASATVHAAEVFTTGASGLSHWRLGNVNWRLFFTLAIPGMLGGAVGAYLLTTLPADTIRPFINCYLILMGVVILWKAARKFTPEAASARIIAPLGLFGGFIDAIGGGGWGPVVASTLIGRGVAPRFVIGSVNIAEFFVTCVISVTFLATIGLQLWPMITGLIIGGVIAAPIAAIVTRKIPARPLMVLVGVVVIALGLRELLPLFL